MAQKKLRVGVLFGGRSAEHEVSIVSARSVMAALDKRKYVVVPIGITKQGRWIAGDNAVKQLESGAQIPAALAQTLPPDPTVHSLVALQQSRGERRMQKSKIPAWPANRKNQKLDVIIPVLHGTYGEDGTVQGLLELAGIPYVGAGVLGSALGMDKVAQKLVYEAGGIPTPRFDYLTTQEWKAKPAIILRRLRKLGLPLFVKPANLGSSVGISKVKQATAKAGQGRKLAAAINLAARYDRRILVEQAVPHAMEIEVAVLGNNRPRASVCGQILSSNEFYDYDAKYVDGRSKAVIPAPLPTRVAKQVRELALQAFKALDLAGMARADFLVNSKTHKVFLSEVNTIPGFTSISMYPKLLDELIRLARERHAARAKLQMSFKPKLKWYR